MPVIFICGFESQRYTVFCCLAFFYAGRGSDNTEIFAFDFGKIKQQGYIIRCNIFFMDNCIIVCHQIRINACKYLLLVAYAALP